MIKALMAVMACLLVVPSHAPSPTTENALAAERELARRLEANDADGYSSMLDEDWAVISATGGLGDHYREPFVNAIKSGYLTRKTVTLSDDRVRVYGDVAIATSHVATSGMFGGKPFDTREWETDVLVWRDGEWKAVLTHESYVHPK